MKRVLKPMKLVAIVLTLATLLPAVAQDDDQAAMEERLKDVPILFNMDTPEVAEIFARGQEVGNRADVFTKVGDSNTTNGDFLLAVGMDAEEFCKLGDYDYLQETIDYFSATAPIPGFNNSFIAYSIAAQEGLSSAAALDPLWSNNGNCQRSEGPVACEYRLKKPAVSIIMLGLMDSRYGEPESFRENLEKIVQTSIEMGVIPVLTTFVVQPDSTVLNYGHSLEMNVASVEIAEEYGTPVINLWAAAQSLPGYGVGPDRTHLAHKVGEFCSFDGAEQQYGGTLRNLLTLEALDELRVNILDAE
jgi:hypothetical protein